MISSKLLDVAQCPDCGGRIVSASSGFACTGCGRSFAGDAGFLDLRPKEAFQEQTKYLDAALHADARHESIAPPVLGSRVRSIMLRRFLKPAAGDRIVDLGCGSGRTLAWNAASGASLTGVDIAPYFAPETIATFDVLLGDLRQLPVRSQSFGKAWSLDVLEHLSRPALLGMLKEANRVLAEGGALFVYTHVRKNGWIAIGTRAVNRFARLVERMGLLDLGQERLRKSDHINPLTDHDDLTRVAAECGFTIERITYYTPILGAFVENVLVRMAERAMARRAAAKAGASTHASDAVRSARRSAQARVRQGGVLYRLLVAISWLMMLDVVLFGRIRSGPFFALLRKTGAPPLA
jgi:SAM-dependent methyltransferase